jgi:hypothetical protein
MVSHHLNITAAPAAISALGRADLHMHTTASDGVADVRQLLDHVARAGALDVIAITDHDTLDASLWAYARQGSYPFEIVPGVEVTSAGGHVLALWVTELVPRGLSLAETADAIHALGGVAVLAHPFHLQMGPVIMRSAPAYFLRPALLAECGFDAVEVYNAGVLTPGSNLLSRRVAEQAGLALVGGSDAHTLGAIGSARTRFAGRSAADLRAALAARSTEVEGAPWPLAEYLGFTRDLIERRGRVPQTSADPIL